MFFVVFDGISLGRGILLEWNYRGGKCNLDRLSDMTARSLSLQHTRYRTGTLTDET